MYEIINKLTQRGLAVIVVSSELQELIGICDRIIVIREGRISGEFAKSDFNQDKIMRAASIYEEANT